MQYRLSSQDSVLLPDTQPASAPSVAVEPYRVLRRLDRLTQAPRPGADSSALCTPLAARTQSARGAGTSLNRQVLLARSVATMLPRPESIRGDSRRQEGTTTRLERDDRQRFIARSPLPSLTQKLSISGAYPAGSRRFKFSTTSRTSSGAARPDTSPPRSPSPTPPTESGPLAVVSRLVPRQHLRQLRILPRPPANRPLDHIHLVAQDACGGKRRFWLNSRMASFWLARACERMETRR